jgi:NTP pyrophosphatase (non-canonical NTP hydrolase)
MEFKEIQEKVVDCAESYGERYNIKIDEDFALLKFYEEVGELAQAVLVHRKKCRTEKYLPEEESKKEVAKEMADVFGMLAVNAHLLGIDLEEAINKKWITREWIKK